VNTALVDSELLVKKLRWQCRRGMKEMDALLVGWLDRRFVTSDPSSQRLFEDLLRTEDDVLWRWLAGRARPDAPEMVELIDEIVASAEH
jgi:antitoxin CptB